MRRRGTGYESLPRILAGAYGYRGLGAVRQTVAVVICPHCATQLPEPYALDWLSVSIADQLHAMASAPSIAGSWTEAASGWIRRQLYPFANYQKRCAQAWESSVRGEWIGKVGKETVGIYPGASAAMAGADEALRALGWRLG